MATVLLLGSGGREHAIAWKLAQSPDVERVLVAPGNGGTAGPKLETVSLDVKDHQAVVALCRERSVSLVVVGPEDPLADGIADSLRAADIACFGPSSAGAQIEADKGAAKRLMRQLDIPTAPFKTFTNAEDAKEYIRSGGGLVVKATGLAAGKGVVVASDQEEACRAVDRMLVDGAFGAAGSTVLVEQLLNGEEVSLMAFTDGRRVAPMPPAQDHKRLLSGDRGSNTGGMGAVAPAAGSLTPQLLRQLSELCFQRLVDHWRAAGVSYVGVLYAGLMVTGDGPMVLEYNCRLGDPETQVVLPLLETDLHSLLMSCVEGRLEPESVRWRDDLRAVDAVLVSDGYPGRYNKGLEITGLDSPAVSDCLVFHAGTRRRDPATLETSGGRVLNLVAVRDSVAAAREAALTAAGQVTFQGKQSRDDIGARAMARELLTTGALTYAAAGVDVAAGDAFVDRIAALLGPRPADGPVVAGVGGFGGLYDLKRGAAGVRDPLLVVGTDGVGTKLKVAQAAGRPQGLGVDLVAMCVNDLLCQGGRPLLFLDYLAAGRLSAAPLDALLAGVLRGCRLAHCHLLGGETAEMPGVYSDSGYDLAGFAVGVVEREECLPRTQLMQPGDWLVGLPSSGLHSNGFSLVRKAVELAGLDYNTDTAPFAPAAASLGEALLTPTEVYVPAVLPLLARPGLVTGMAHITGGGLPGNLPRCLPSHLAARLDTSAWLTADRPGAAAAAWVSLTGGVGAGELARALNLGLGLVLVVPAARQQEALAVLREAGHPGLTVGRLENRAAGAGDGSQVVLDGLVTQLSAVMAGLVAAGAVARPLPPPRQRVGVLISGSGTNLQALIDRGQRPDCSYELVLVISNKEGVQGLARAEAAGIQHKVISHRGFSCREEFDLTVHAALLAADVRLVCCAGFMRILSPKFVSLWRGRLMNVHPSLLPSFPGLHVHRQALRAGVRLSGCSVHFVEEDVDSGAIIAQRSVPVLPDDTEHSLEARVKAAEHEAYPEALELVASGAVRLDEDGQLAWPKR